MTTEREAAERAAVVDTMPTSQRCPIGPYNAHTYNYERDECIWCGPNRLCSKPGRWVSIGDGYNAWSATDDPDRRAAIQAEVESLS